MGTPTVTNILKSNAVLWYAPVGETLPDETSIDFNEAWGGNWARVGYTKEPLAMGIEDERAKFNVEEELTPVDERRTMFQPSFETVLAEVTGGYLSLMVGGTVATTAAGAGQKGYEELDFGEEAVITKYAWGFEGLYLDSSGNELPLRVFIINGTAKLNGNLEWSQRNDEYVGMPIRIEALANAGDSPVKFQRVTAPASS